MKEFFIKNWTTITLSILGVIFVYLLVRVFTPTPDMSELNKYKLEEIDKHINEVKTLQKNLSDSIKVYQHKIDDIDNIIFNMKKIIFLILFVFVSFISEAQIKKSVDTTQMSIPYNIVQKILVDLNDYDKLKELSRLDKKEITELNSKIVLLEKTNKTWVEKDSLSGQIILQTEEKVKIYKEENKRLNKEYKRLKTKNTLFNIISGVIIAPLTYLLIIK